MNGVWPPVWFCMEGEEVKCRLGLKLECGVSCSYESDPFFGVFGMNLLFKGLSLISSLSAHVVQRTLYPLLQLV